MYGVGMPTLSQHNFFSHCYCGRERGAVKHVLKGMLKRCLTTSAMGVEFEERVSVGVGCEEEACEGEEGKQFRLP